MANVQYLPRAEHPEPQFERKSWQNLNGEWEFEFDFGKSGRERKLYEAERFIQKIMVPFCPESKLSGIGYTDFISCVWYRKTVTITEEQLAGVVMLHFGAVDNEAFIYVNGELAGTHKGGYTSFALDITKYLRAGDNSICVCAEDDVRSDLVPSGKQSELFSSHGCHYTRTTGIWQTVWLEFLPVNYIKSVKYYPDSVNGKLTITAEVVGNGTLTAAASYKGKAMGSDSCVADGFVTLTINLAEKHLWEVGKGRLYDLKLTFGDDKVSSYFGLRSIKIDGYKFLINGKSVFQRLVLDQGFYPDGIYTAPSDKELKADVERSLAVGFNGARLHEKVFEPRFLYYCDKLGYLAWGEFPNWGIDHSKKAALPQYLREWTESVERDFNHPAIIGWCPFNETWDRNGKQQWKELLRCVYETTKQLDPTRPCIDTSGNYHVVTDIFDVHDYEQDPIKFKQHCDLLFETGDSFDDRMKQRQHYNGGICFVSEYGGIAWNMDGTGWGYGTAPASAEEYLARYKGLTDVLLDDERMFGFCYTQLYDVEQEKNGLYTYDRCPKFDTEYFKDVNSRKAAIED